MLDYVDGRLVRMRLEDLMRTYRPAYGKDWAEGFTFATSDQAQIDRVELLRHDLRTDGRLRRPIRLDEKEHRLSDGMHRLLAHYLEGVQELEVQIEGSIPYSSTGCIEVRFRCNHDPMEDELIDSALSSFPIGQEWAQCDGLGRTGVCDPEHLLGPVFDGWYYWDRERIGELVAALTLQAQRYGARLEVISAEHISDEELGGTSSS